MSELNILVTGTPRSGTTLTCHLLNKVPDTVALHEPMRGRDLKDHDGMVAAVERFCGAQRTSIGERKRAISKHMDGAVPANPVGTGRSASGLRQRLVSRGEIVVDKPLSPDFALVVKHCSAFTAALDRLVAQFPVYAVVRNPLATLASWSSVEFAVQQGHARNAERLDPSLRGELGVMDDELDRQILLLGWFHERIRRYLPAEAIIPYESIVETGGKALAVIRPAAASLEEPMRSQNTSSLYDHERMRRMGERLLNSDGAYWQSYTRESVERLLCELERTTESDVAPARGTV